jgi:hypothetical protein
VSQCIRIQLASATPRIYCKVQCTQLVCSLWSNKQPDRKSSDPAPPAAPSCLRHVSAACQNNQQGAKTHSHKNRLFDLYSHRSLCGARTSSAEWPARMKKRYLCCNGPKRCMHLLPPPALFWVVVNPTPPPTCSTHTALCLIQI